MGKLSDVDLPFVKEGVELFVPGTFVAFDNDRVTFTGDEIRKAFERTDWRNVDITAVYSDMHDDKNFGKRGGDTRQYVADIKNIRMAAGGKMVGDVHIINPSVLGPVLYGQAKIGISPEGSYVSVRGAPDGLVKDYSISRFVMVVNPAFGTEIPRNFAMAAGNPNAAPMTLNDSDNDTKTRMRMATGDDNDNAGAGSAGAGISEDNLIAAIQGAVKPIGDSVEKIGKRMDGIETVVAKVSEKVNGLEDVQHKSVETEKETKGNVQTQEGGDTRKTEKAPPNEATKLLALADKYQDSLGEIREAIRKGKSLAEIEGELRSKSDADRDKRMAELETVLKELKEKTPASTKAGETGAKTAENAAASATNGKADVADKGGEADGGDGNAEKEKTTKAEQDNVATNSGRRMQTAAKGAATVGSAGQTPSDMKLDQSVIEFLRTGVGNPITN